MNIYFKFLLPILLLNNTVLSQITDLEKKTDIVSQKILLFYNDKQPDKIYELTNAYFKSQIKSETFKNALEQQLFPYGAITKLTFENSIDSTNIYKADLAANVVLNMLVSLDNEGKVSGFQLRPYKKAIKESDKRKNYYNDNALKTPLDSLVHKYASNFIETTKSPGLAVGILIGTKSYFYNYGDAKKGEDIHPTKKTVFEIGSITKTFTAFLLADAVIKNKIKLEDAITKYLPDSVASNEDLQKITIEQLANHSSGLPRLPLNLYFGVKDKNNPYAEYDDQHLFSFLHYFKAIRKPGEKYEYSNLAVGLLGVILERVNKKPLEEQYNEIIFKPLKMLNTYSTQIKDSTMAAIGYDENGKPTNYWNFKALAGAGAIKSTTEDLINYSIPFALMPRTKGKYDPRILLLQKLTFKESPALISLAWNFNTEDSTSFIMQHSGGTGGFRSNISIMPSKKLAVVVLNNCAEEPGSPIVADAIIKALSKLEK